MDHSILIVRKERKEKEHYICQREKESKYNEKKERNKQTNKQTKEGEGEAIILVYFGLVLWHINHFRLFNASSSLYIYINYIWFGWVGFYGISTIVGYLMPNPLYTYISTI